MGELNIDLEDYESKLEKLNKLIQKMSVIDWTDETAIQFCIDQGMKPTGAIISQYANCASEINSLKNFNYEVLKDKKCNNR